jgi:asparagine synthase (glutamine-hydrolysing)
MKAPGNRARSSYNSRMHQYVTRVVDLLDPAANRILNLTCDQARARLLHGTPGEVRGIDGSFALMAREGKRVRLARSMTG